MELEELEELWDSTFDEPYEFVEVEPLGGETQVPQAYAERILVDTVHDGDVIPRRYRYDDQGRPRISRALLGRRFADERDWGASLVAERLAGYLGIPGYRRLRLARVLLDFNRFPGATPPGTDDPLARQAINQPFIDALDHGLKMTLLEEHYDRISDLMEQALLGRLIKIGVHTYDERNPNQTRRPDVSLISRSASYQRESRMQYGVFDPIYPDVLGESTCSRVLRNRVSLNLERAGVRCGHNHPYLLPEGCVEVRSQVWYFFLYTRRQFEEAYPETKDELGYRMVWTMLLNTNLRLQESEALRGYLHRFRKVPVGALPRYRAAQDAYAHVREFVEKSAVVESYRRSANRPSSLVVEVRKDLVCRREPGDRRPTRLIEENADRVAKVIAGAITIYLETDREVPEDGVSTRISDVSSRIRGHM